MAIDPTIAESLSRGSSGPTVKFTDIGDKVVLKITGLEQRQQTDFHSGAPLTWPDGKPKMQYVFTGIDQDTGEETRLFAKGFLLGAIKDALAESKAPLEEGGILAVQFSHEEPPAKVGMNPAKKYRAQYQPPKISVSSDDLI